MPPKPSFRRAVLTALAESPAFALVVQDRVRCLGFAQDLTLIWRVLCDLESEGLATWDAVQDDRVHWPRKRWYLTLAGCLQVQSEALAI